jgi:hypothetical protein
MAIKNESDYLISMSKPLQEKLKISAFISPSAINVLDVGCADGTVTSSMVDSFVSNLKITEILRSR